MQLDPPPLPNSKNTQNATQHIVLIKKTKEHMTKAKRGIVTAEGGIRDRSGAHYSTVVN